MLHNCHVARALTVTETCEEHGLSEYLFWGGVVGSNLIKSIVGKVRRCRKKRKLWCHGQQDLQKKIMG